MAHRVHLGTKLISLDDISQLNEDEQLEAFNSAKRLVATVVGHDEDQVICRRMYGVGTNVQETACKMIAEMRKNQD